MERDIRHQEYYPIEEIIRKGGGGKLEVTKKLQEAGFPVPRSQYLYFDDLNNSRLIEAAYRDLNAPVTIVRASHVNDWHGYIDVLPTVKGVKNIDELNNVIRKIKQVAASDALKIHAEDWGQSFTPEVHVLLQEQSQSNISGSMLRHPHLLDRVDIQYSDRYKNICGQEECVRDNFLIIDKDTRWGNNWKFVGIEDLDLCEKYYKEVEDSGIFDPKYVYQMEIGFNPFYIYQLRPFKEKQPVVNFEIPNFLSNKNVLISSDLVFGITPKEGITLPFKIVNWRDIDGVVDDMSKKNEPYGIILNGKLSSNLNPKIKTGVLSAFIISGDDNFCYLEHNLYRFMKKARYSIMSGYVPYKDLLKKIDLNETTSAKLISNGERAVLLI